MEHRAIIITGAQSGKLNREEMLVYTLIAGRVLETFMPPYKMEYTTVDAMCAARKFCICTHRILKKGWLGILEREHLVAKGYIPYQVVSDLFQEETLLVVGYNLIHKKLLPVSLYTDGGLVNYMDKAGLGTIPTRTDTSRTLLERKYVRYSGKYVAPTPKGLLLYETVRGVRVADVFLAPGWETELAQIERGELSRGKFLDGVLEMVNEVTGEILRNRPVEKRPRGVT